MDRQKRGSLLISFSGTAVKFISRRSQTLVPMLAQLLPVFTDKYRQTKKGSLLMSISGIPVKFTGRRGQTLVPMLAPAVAHITAGNQD